MSTWLYDEHGVPRMRLIYDGRILDIEDNLVGWVSFSNSILHKIFLLTFSRLEKKR